MDDSTNIPRRSSKQNNWGPENNNIEEEEGEEKKHLQGQRIEVPIEIWAPRTQGENRIPNSRVKILRLYSIRVFVIK